MIRSHSLRRLPVICGFALLAMASLSLPTAAHAAISLRFNSVTISEGTATTPITLLISSASGDEVFGLSADVQGPADFEASGDIGLTGFFASGNLDPSSQFIRDAGDNTIALLSLDLNVAMAVPMLETPAARINLATGSLTEGVYNVTLSNVTFLDQNAMIIPAIVQGGTITVSAVPEPTACVLMWVAICGWALPRRSRSVCVQGKGT
ncbi:hypothetical protein [Stieleria varia]|uniref:PEP-CTERM protein-sorting domain-containing protein n=1 Tax=Stieleria varia TaxID=2528005 RepID=A0A5C6AWB4_9BACT|nr:hypothetical protein [Stieleria varia]TWU04233.1 hypothetical protein Pla52n_22720 [Stieleria varia]